MLEISEYEALRRRPLGRPVMFQRWRSLLFLHFATEPQLIQRLLPPGLTVDTCPNAEGKEMAWVGLVPFRMEGVTPRGIPPIHGIHAFPETNVRTYVHRDGKEPGVWFFSLDAGNALACRVARRFFSLPYHEANMTAVESDWSARYHSRRCKGGQVCRVECELGYEDLHFYPGSLAFFLVERYLLYAVRGSTLRTGRVYHKPYPLRSVTSLEVDETLVEAAGISPLPFTHALFSPGLDVEVFRLR